MRTLVIVCALALSGCFEPVPGWGARFNGHPIETADDVGRALEDTLAASPEEYKPIAQRNLNRAAMYFRDVESFDSTYGSASGIFVAPYEIYIATGGRDDLGDTALYYELFRLVHYAATGDTLDSYDHQYLYGETIQALMDQDRAR